MRLTFKQSGLIIICLILPSTHAKADDSLRSVLEQAWDNHILAYYSGNEGAVKKTTSSFAFATMINNLRDSKRELTPELIKRLAKNKPDISQMKFVKTVESGPTAALVYTKDSSFGEGSTKTLTTFAFLKFVKEQSEWKVDLIYIYQCDKNRTGGKECNLDVKELPPLASIDGKVREAPPLIPVPFAAGYLDIDPAGYKTTISINGIRQYSGAEGGSRLIAGGLRKGLNTVTVVFEKQNKVSSYRPSVTIRRILEEKVFKEIFKYEPESDIKGERTIPFTIDK